MESRADGRNAERLKERFWALVAAAVGWWIRVILLVLLVAIISYGIFVPSKPQVAVQASSQSGERGDKFDSPSKDKTRARPQQSVSKDRNRRSGARRALDKSELDKVAGSIRDVGVDTDMEKREGKGVIDGLDVGDTCLLQ